MKLKIITIIIFISLLAYSVPANAEDINISLTWQTSTLVPKNYQGRSLPIRGSVISVFAFPAKYNSGSLIFDWYLDKTYMKYSSGLGKDIFSFTATEWPGYEHDIKVKISNSQDTVSGYASISIEVQKPEIYVFKGHEHDNEYIANPGSSNTFSAQAYFFNISNLDSLTYKWYINNEQIKNTGALSNPERFTLDIASGSRSSKYKISSVAQNKHNLIEKAVQEFKVIVK